MIVRATVLYPRLARSGGFAPLCVLASILDLPLRLGAYLHAYVLFRNSNCAIPKMDFR